jgi:hypothetical protein
VQFYQHSLQPAAVKLAHCLAVGLALLVLALVLQVALPLMFPGRNGSPVLQKLFSANLEVFTPLSAPLGAALKDLLVAWSECRAAFREAHVRFKINRMVLWSTVSVICRVNITGEDTETVDFSGV